MPDLRGKHQAVFYVGLSQQLLPLLEKSQNYSYATRAIDLCWQWIEKQDVAALVLFYLYHDEDDYGVEPAMSDGYSHDLVMWNVWGCVSVALIYTAYCAYGVEGGPLPETLELADADVTSTAFVKYFEGAKQDSRILGEFATYLERLSDGQLTESVISAKLSELFSCSEYRQ